MKTLLLATMATLLSTALPGADLLNLPLKDIAGKDTTLKALGGKAYLVVNVASQCGYTGQYAGLEALQQKYKATGLTVVGVPCNDFGGQEPGSEEEIKTFCTTNYKVTFPMLAKVAIKGDSPHPLYAALIKEAGDVGWNFTKFLVTADGSKVVKYDSDVEPDSESLITAIDKALK